ncbi:hypothetical protein, partial [Legionella pneumophila]|uniref:hypothetical protein n=1 Tax=Legionella pneumophila TaxID=446 RepID=UPI000A500F52
AKPLLGRSLRKTVVKISNFKATGLLRRYDGPKNRTVQSGNKQEGDKYASFGYSLAYLST